MYYIAKLQILYAFTPAKTCDLCCWRGLSFWFKTNTSINYEAWYNFKESSPSTKGTNFS